MDTDQGVPLSLSTKANIKRLIANVGEFIELKDPAKARGFLRVKVDINTVNPLVNGCWLKMEANRDTWVDFRYEILHDFCYRCGHIGHANNECSFEPNR